MGAGSGSRSGPRFVYAGNCGVCEFPRHGCDVEINLRCGETIAHLRGNQVTYPTVRSHKDGVRIGCTFVSTEALEQIYKWHKEFLFCEDFKTWQA